MKVVRQRHLNDLIDTKDFIARPYQVELYETCKLRNTIVCLNTGGGKTFIAVMLIKHYSPELHSRGVRMQVEDRVEDEVEGDVEEELPFAGKRTFFLVPTVPLVSQQAKVIRIHTDLKVGEFHGQSYDDWTVDQWNDQFKQYSVFVMIDEIFRKIVYQGFISLSRVNLIIFDEVHRAVKNAPYREIMRCFEQYSPHERPRILGLSASLIMNNASPQNIEVLIRKLEQTMRSTCETPTDLRTINKYLSKPTEQLIKYHSFCMSINRDFKIALHYANSCIEFLNDVNYKTSVPQTTVNLKTLCKSIQDTLYVLATMGVWCALHVSIVYIRELSDTVEMLRSTKSHYTGLLSVVLTTLNVIKVKLNHLLDDVPESDRLTKFTSPKLIRLAQLLQNYNPDRNDQSLTNLCGIIFVERRAVARILCIWLQNMVKSNSKDYSHLKADFVLGLGSRSGVGSSSINHMSNKKQEESLKKFRSHECNLLIATSVLEEGLDVPRCNLVIRYDPPKTFREYIQSKGRARADRAHYVIFAEDSQESQKLYSDLEKYKKTENLFSNYCNNRNAPTESEIDDSFDDQLMAPYMPNKVEGAARVTLNSAIAIVNRYCLKLPSDSFTKLTPQYNIEILDNLLYRCRLCLPINSPIRYEIIGPDMPKKSTAKKAAALLACEKLHKAGELDDNFLPVGKETIKYIEQLGLEPPIDEQELVDGSGPRPGTTKRRQYYYKRIADVLNYSIEPKITYFLYEFSMKLSYPIPEEQNTRGRKITDPAESSQNFGILTAHKVPPICDFPVFTRSGEVIIKFEAVRQDFSLSEKEIQELAIFHNFTFSDVLRLIKVPLQFDPIKSNCKYFVVPVNTVYDSGERNIDWNFVRSIKKQKENPPLVPNENERLNFTFDRQIYNDAVVIPWYRKDKPQFFFYVAEICDNLTPKSPFPDEGYETFEKYYSSKYNIKIMNLNQPLLDVDHTSARLNLLTPRYVNRKGISLPTSTAKTKKEKRENLQQKQILVPELCNVHPFPASLWRKAVCLPCMLYRLNSLLVAEQLRSRVAKETGVGITDLTKIISWPPLDFGWTLSQVVNQTQEESSNHSIVESRDTSFKFNESEEVSHETWNFMACNDENNAADNKDVANVAEDRQETGDLIIDVFDPNKYNINNDDMFFDEIDDLDDEDEELRNIDWAEPINIIGGPNGFSATSMPINLNFFNNSVHIREIESIDENEVSDNSVVRYGSPSCFNSVNPIEGREWDFDDDIKAAAICHIGLPGLEMISSNGGLNIDELSKDLASFPVDALESDCEASDCDDLDSDDDSDDNNYYNQDSNKRKTYTSLKYENTISDILDYELLRNSPPILEDLTKTNEKIIKQLCEDICNEELQDYEISTNENVNSDDNIYSVKIDKPISNSNIIETSENISELLNNYLVCDKEEDEEIIDNDNDLNNELICNEFSTHLKEQKAEEIQSEKTITNESKSIAETLPCFGDLLPDRDINSQYKEPYSIIFDPLKSDDNNMGPSPSMILQALTMSNASDGINLERLETVGDSFLKYAVTAFLYCVCPGIHEGKLSYLRSRQISNRNLYRLGKKIGIGEFMNATKFEPNDNWCPPCYTIPNLLDDSLNEDKKMINNNLNEMRVEEKLDIEFNKEILTERPKETKKKLSTDQEMNIPYNLLTQHSIPDKSIADCVEALIGAYLIASGPKGALLFMKWLDLKVMPNQLIANDDDDTIWHWLPTPKSPLLQIPFDNDNHIENNILITKQKLNELYLGQRLDIFEQKLEYSFRDKAYLVQAFTHNSYYENQITDCYQRLEFLGDAVLDYLITRYLYEDPVGHSPGTLTDLRSALVNNTFFASLAVKYEFYKHLKMLSFDLYRVVNAFVIKFKHNDDRTNDYNLFIAEGESENAEDIEVPKALGDIFESVAGAIYLDSGMSLDAVWKVYYNMMKPEIEYFSTHVPKSPIRELLEMEPQNAKFGKPESITGRKIRVCVEVFGEGKFFGIGRNKRIAKCTAAKRALRALKLKRNSNNFK